MSLNSLAELASVIGAATTAPVIVEEFEIPNEPKQLEVKAAKAVLKAPANVSKSKADKFDILKNVEKTLNAQFKTSFSIVRLGAKVGEPIPSTPTNLPSLDYGVLSCGGVPRGKIIEIWGPESSGKTTLALHIIACEQQNTDNLCAVVDAEHALDPTYAAKLGVNVDELLISQPNSGEQALETVESLIDSKAVSIIVIDSVAALVPQAELDGDMGDSHMGLHARLMSQAMRKLTGKAAANSVTLIFINQVREKIGVMFGSNETTTGGRALKFFASIRLDTRRKDVIGEKEHPIGHEIKIKAVKNKCGPPMRDTIIRLLYESGIDIGYDIVKYGEEVGVITKSGTWYAFKNNSIGQLTAAAERVTIDSELRKEILKEIRNTLDAQREKENA
jgi:recombination protein RecA